MGRSEKVELGAWKHDSVITSQPPSSWYLQTLMYSENRFSSTFVIRQTMRMRTRPTRRLLQNANSNAMLLLIMVMLTIEENDLPPEQQTRRRRFHELLNLEARQDVIIVCRDHHCINLQCQHGIKYLVLETIRH